MANDDERGIGETHTNLAIRQTIVDGAEAEAEIEIPGWQPGSSIKSVIDWTAGEDVTADFTESENGMVGGIDSSESSLLVLFIAAHPKGGSLTRS